MHLSGLRLSPHATHEQCAARCDARRQQVGELNQKLTNLCRQGLFKQRRILLLSIGYKGDKGQGVTGIAQKDWNLYDPRGVAEADLSFFQSGLFQLPRLCCRDAAATPSISTQAGPAHDRLH